ncbi:MAG: sulfatase [Verrucomicrobiota bacterium]
MKRRDFIKRSTAAAAGTALAPGAMAAEGKRKPNLLVIHCDELNFRTIGAYRDTLSPEQAFMWGPKAVCDTPFIDSLAKEGAICTKMYAATPVCSPSRSSFISGQYPQNTPVTTNSISLNDDVVSFAEILGKAGYATGYAGKWHLDGEDKPGWAPERKFGFEDNRYMCNRGHWKQLEDTPDGPRVKARDKKGNPSYGVEGADEESFTTDFLTTKTIDFVNEHAGEPFCYMLSIPDPHGPDTVRAPYDTMYSDDDVEEPRTYGKSTEGVPNWAMPDKKCHYKMAQYHGMMKCIDDNVGRIIGALREKGILDDTILVFTADHGDMRGEHGRQNKGVPMEASAKIPFLIRYPEKIAAETRIDHVYNTVDFLPTMLSMMGVETAGREEGRDFAAIFESGKAPKDWEDVTFMRSTGKTGATKGWFSAVTPRYKLIVSGYDEPWLLDLEEDPDELVNFVANPERKAVVKKLARALKRYAKAHGDSYIEDEKTAADIQALGG